MTDVSNLDNLAAAIATNSPKIRDYAMAQAAATQSQELDIQKALGAGVGLRVDDFGAKGDATTNDSAAFMAAHNALNINQGGDIYLRPGGRYLIGTPLLFDRQGLRLIGGGHPGTSLGEAKGTTQMIVPNAITGITFNSSGTHQTRGYAMESIHVIAQTGATTGNGILVKDCERMLFRDVTVSDFIGGYGLRIDGGSGNAQYAELVNFSAGDCMTGLHTQNAGPNGITMFGGYFAGKGVAPRVGSKAIHLQKGDTLRLFGTKIQGWETAVDLNPPDAQYVFHELHGLRSEFNNIGVRVRTGNRWVTLFGGNFDNYLLAGGGASVGVQIDAGAEDVALIRPTFGQVTNQVIDNGARTARWP